jgi:hypothetical protein
MESMTGKTGNKRYSLARLGFISFLLLSPLLPYLITRAYNRMVFRIVAAQIQSLPSYPEAELVEYVVQEYPPTHCQEWVFRYKTDATIAQIGSFYRSALLEAGWRTDSKPAGFDRYQNSTMNIIIDYDEVADGRRITISVMANMFLLFEFRCP